MSVPIHHLNDLAETCVFGKQSLGPVFCGRIMLQPQGLHTFRLPFFRSYGNSLPSSLTRHLSSTLEYSSHPPVLVLVRSPNRLTRGFSWQCGINTFARSVDWTPHHSLRLMSLRICLKTPSTSLDLHFRSKAYIASCVTPLLKRLLGGTGIFYPVIHRLRLSASS